MVLESRSWINWSWRVLVGDMIYLFLYLLAGMILYFSYPALMEFYGDKLPPMALMVQTQLFLRGFVFVGIVILISKTVSLPMIQLALLTGIVFSVIGGISPLIPPNDLMPLNIRLVHGLEVGVSNTLLGVLLTYLLAQCRAESAVPA